MNKRQTALEENREKDQEGDDVLVLDESNLKSVVTFNDQGQMLIKDPRDKEE